MSDAVLKIGAVFDKEQLEEGITAGQSAVEAATDAMTVSFQKIQSASTAAWNKVAEDVRSAADGVSDAAVRVAEATKASSDAYAQQRNALNLVRKETSDQALATRVLAAAQEAARQRTLELKAAQEALGASSHKTVTDIQATSAVVRSLDGNPGIRSVERFIGTTLGLGGAMQKIFPLIGAAGLAGMFIHMGEAAYEAEQKGVHAAEEIGRAFGEQTEKLHMANDELELQNSKLADEIAKLEHHPSNGLETALLQAVVAADKLQASLASDVKEMQELLKQHDVSFFEGALSGVVPTGSTSKEIVDFAHQVEESGQRTKAAMTERLLAANQAYKQAEKSAGDNHAALKAAADAFHAAQEAAEKEYYARMDDIAGQAKQHMLERVVEIKAKQQELNEHTSQAANQGLYFRAPDFSAQIKQFEGAAQGFGEIQQRAALSGTNFDLEQHKGELEGDKTNKGARGPNPDEENLRKFEQSLAKMKASQDVSIRYEHDYWQQKLSELTEGSTQYGHVLDRIAQLAEEGKRKFQEAIQKLKEKSTKDSTEDVQFGKEFGRISAEMQGWLDKTYEDLTRTGERWRGYWHAVAEGQQQAARANAEFEEQQLAAKHAAGGITDLAYAEQMQQIHARTAAAEIKILTDELARLQQMAAKSPKDAIGGNLLDPKLAEQIKQLENQLAQLQAKMKQQGFGDSAKIRNEIEKPFTDAFHAINQGWLKLQRDLILGTGNIKKDFVQMGANLVVSLAQSIEKMLAQWALYEMRTLISHQITNQAKVASDTMAAGESLTIKQAFGLKQALIDAKNAAVAGWKAGMALPFPEDVVMAPTLAAVGFAGAMAQFEHGGVVDGAKGYAVPIIAHAGERVLTTAQTQNFDRMVNNSSNSSNRTNNVRTNVRQNINTPRAAGPRESVAAVKKAVRNGQMRGM